MVDQTAASRCIQRGERRSVVRGRLPRARRLVLGIAVAVLAWCVLGPATAASAADVTFTPNPVVGGGTVTARVPLPAPPPTDTPTATPPQVEVLPPPLRLRADPKCTVVMDDVRLQPQACGIDGTDGVVQFVVPKSTTTGTHQTVVSVNDVRGFGELLVQPPSPVLVTVPELRPLEVREAARALAEAGLFACPQHTTHVKPSWFVIDQSPDPGVSVPARSCVTVEVAEGVEVPDLTGLTTDQAKKKLDPVFLGLTPAQGSGTIRFQRPQPRKIVRPRTTVVVTLEVIVPPTGSTSTQGPTGPTSSSATSTDSPTASSTEQIPTATVGGEIERVGYTVPVGATLGVLALLAVFVAGRLLPRPLRGRRETGRVSTPSRPPIVPGPSEPSHPVPSQQPHTFALRIRSDQGSELRLVDADAVAVGRVGLTSTPDPTLEPSLVEELS